MKRTFGAVSRWLALAVAITLIIVIFTVALIVEFNWERNLPLTADLTLNSVLSVVKGIAPAFLGQFAFSVATGLFFRRLIQKEEKERELPWWMKMFGMTLGALLAIAFTVKLKSGHYEGYIVMGLYLFFLSIVALGTGLWPRIFTRFWSYMRNTPKQDGKVEAL